MTSMMGATTGTRTRTAAAVGMLLVGAFTPSLEHAHAQTGGVRTWVAPSGTTYVYVPGQFTQQEAWREAVRRGGYPVVFGSMAEHTMVVNAFGFRSIAPCHTGHYQLPTGREPAGGWVTYTGEASAPLNLLFNSNGPDDGIRGSWVRDDDGTWYYVDVGKNEDAGVVWYDNGGKLEDVSVNQRCGVMVEIPRRR